MASLALRINVVDQNNVKTMQVSKAGPLTGLQTAKSRRLRHDNTIALQFEPSMIVYDACKMIRERIGEPPGAGKMKIIASRSHPFVRALALPSSSPRVLYHSLFSRYKQRS